MVRLEIHYGLKPAEARDVSASHPVSIGRHVSNDICVDEPDVAPIHCRVTWNGTYAEVASAQRDGIDLNGTLIKHARLKAGDVLRIGSADVVVREVDGQDASAASKAARPAPPAAPPPAGPPGKSPSERPIRGGQVSVEVPLKPMTEETVAHREGWGRRVFHPTPNRGSAAQSPPGGNAGWSAPSRPGDRSYSDVDADDSESAIPVVLAAEQSSPIARPLRNRLSASLNERRVRPGEQEALRSPIILGLFGTVLALGLAAAAIYFVIGRESTQQQFDAAVSEFEAKHYSDAATLFERFIHDHGRHPLAADAHYRMWDARVLREIGGSLPAWKRGLDALNESIDANKEREDFHAHDSETAEFATQIAFGAAKSAESNKDREFLNVFSAAEATIARFSPDGKIAPALAGRLRASLMAAQNSILRYEDTNAKIADIEKANAARQPMAALESRRSLLARYPDAAADPRLAMLLKQTLDVEKSLVKKETLNKAPVSDDPSAGVRPSLTLALHTRSQTAEPAGTQPVFVLAKDSCFALDHATGTPVWKRVIGVDTPFFPIRLTGNVPSLLMFDTNRLALVLVDERNGRLLWQQNLGDVVSGPPLIDQGQAYVATLGNRLYKIDVQTGRLTARLTFSQKILSPPALARNGERLVVAGDASLIYTLSVSPLDCVRVNDLGHAAGSLVHGVTAMGSLVLLTETGRPSGTRLHVLDARSEETWLKPLQTETVEGQVRDAPILYGKMLFVASSPPRISAFSVSDQSGQEPLTRTTSLAIPNQEESPIYLSGGPDGQLWMAGSSLRRLQLKLNAQSFVLDPAEVAVGISSQPLQTVGPYLFAARHVPYAGTVFFSQVDREPMIGRWRTALGSSLIACTASASGDLVCVGEAGEVFVVGRGELAGGFKLSATSTIEPPPGTRNPLRGTVLDDGQIAVDCTLPKPTLWLIGTGGQISTSFSLEHPLEAPPARLRGALVLPLPGRLRLASVTGGSAAGEDFLAPVEGDKQSRWTFVGRLNDSDLIAVDDRGRINRLQYRTEPVRHLATVQSMTVDRPIDVALALTAANVAYATVDGQFRILDSNTLEPVFTEKLSAPPAGNVWTVGANVLVETRDHQLSCYELAPSPKRRFRIAIPAAGLAGRPQLMGGRLVASLRDGTVLAIDPADGRIAGKAALGQALSGPVLSSSGQPIVPTIDGSLIGVDADREARKAVP